MENPGRKYTHSALKSPNAGGQRSIEGDTDTKNAVYAMTEEFIEKFEARNGSIICRKLLGYNISIEQEYTIMKEKGLFKSICPRFVTDAVEILEEMCDV